VRFLVFSIVLALSACAPRGTITYFPGAGQIGDVQSIFVASTRELDDDGAPTRNRGGELLFGQVGVSIPETREPGEINWPQRATPDPAKHFLVDNYERFASKTAFEAAMSRALRGRRGEERTATVFVHGFNNRFSEGLYRFAQLNADLDLPFLPVHYSWPSAGHPLGYGYDRDSLLYARDGLEATVRSVSKSGVDEVLLFVVDILKEEATLLIPNDVVKGVAEKSFGATVEGDAVVLPGIMSRKKQIIPNIKV